MINEQVPAEPEQPITSEEVQAEASRVAHERVEGSASVDFSVASDDLVTRQAQQKAEEAEKRKEIAVAHAKEERLQNMDRWSQAQGKITEERAAAARDNEQTAKNKLASAESDTDVADAEHNYRERNKEISDMRHRTGTTMTSKIYGKPTLSGDISQDEVSDMTPNRIYPSGGRTGPRDPLLSPKNISDQSKQDQKSEAA